MPNPFFANALGDPRNLAERWAVQADPDIPAATGFHDCRSYGGTPTPTAKEVARQVMTSAMPDTPLEGQLDIPDSQRELGDLDCGNFAHLALFASMLRHYDLATAGDANTFTLSQLGGSLSPQQFTNLVNDDTGVTKRFHSVMPKGFVLAAAPGGNLNLKVTTVEGKMDVHGPTTQEETGSGSTLPEFRLTMKVGGVTADDSADVDIYLKVISLISTTGAVCQVKLSAAGTYSASFNVTFGQWVYLPGLGTRSEQPQVYWPTGATLTANDVFKCPKRRQPWTPAYPPFRSIALTQVRFYYADEQINLDGGLTATFAVADAKRRMGTERQAIGTQRFGPQTTSIVLNREMVDLLVQRALLDQAVHPLVIEAVSDIPIGSSNVPYGVTLIAPALRASGPLWNVKAGGSDRKEALTLTASRAETPYHWGGVDYEADITVVWNTDLTALS